MISSQECSWQIRHFIWQWVLVALPEAKKTKQKTPNKTKKPQTTKTEQNNNNKNYKVDNSSTRHGTEKDNEAPTFLNKGFAREKLCKARQRLRERDAWETLCCKQEPWVSPTFSVRSGERDCCTAAQLGFGAFVAYKGRTEHDCFSGCCPRTLAWVMMTSVWRTQEFSKMEI